MTKQKQLFSDLLCHHALNNHGLHIEPFHMGDEGLNDKRLSPYLSYLKTHALTLHALVNHVASPLTALMVGAMGVRLAMSDHPNEIKDFIKDADGLYVNLGTPDSTRFQAINLAMQAANAQNIPILLDPVMIDRSTLRRDYAIKLLQENKVSIRLNHSEYPMLAQYIKPSSNHPLILTGIDNFVLNQEKALHLTSLAPLMGYRIGLGCVLGAVLTVFIAIAEKLGVTPHQGTTIGLFYYLSIGAEAEKTSQGPASLSQNMADLIYQTIFKF